MTRLRILGILATAALVSGAAAEVITRYRVGFDRYGIYRYEDEQRLADKVQKTLDVARRDPLAAYRMMESYVPTHLSDLAATKIYVDCALASENVARVYAVLSELRLRNPRAVGPTYGLALLGDEIRREVPPRHSVRDYPLLDKQQNVLVQEAFSKGRRSMATEVLWSDARDVQQLRDYWKKEATVYGNKDPRRILMYAAMLTLSAPNSMLVERIPGSKGTRVVPNRYYENFAPNYSEAIVQARKALSAEVKSPIAFYVIGFSEAHLGRSEAAKASFLKFLKLANPRDPRTVPAKQYVEQGTLKSLEVPLDWRQKFFF